MTVPTATRGATGRPWRPPGRLGAGSVGLFLCCAAWSVSSAQRVAPSGEEVYIDRLGCWNCHGTTGEGAGGGVVLERTALPLRRFVGSIRLPSKQMPPVASTLASDAELAIVYRWLDGVEAVAGPPPIAIELTSPARISAGGRPAADVAVELVARTADTAAASDVPAESALGYRVTLISATGAPLAHHAVDYQPAGRPEWARFTTDEHGEMSLDRLHGVVLAGARQPRTTPARLRMALPSGKTALVVEMLDYTAPAAPVVVGIGSAIVRVE